MARMTAELWWKAGGAVLALVPIGFFLMFALGEGFFVGWTHYVQAAVPLVAIALAWWQPRIGGAILAALGLTVGIWYFVEASHLRLVVIALVELIAFVPLVLSGLLFLYSTRYEAPLPIDTLD